MKSRSALSLLAIAATLFEPTGAFFRMRCMQGDETRKAARLDPIVNKNELSTHAHALAGGSGISFNSDYDAMIDSECTSCQVEEDKSAYWTPALMFEYDNGTTVPVETAGGILIYYLFHGENVQPFPKGFQVLAGDPKLRDFPWKANPQKNTWSGDELSQLALSQKAIGFNCLNYNGPAEPTLFRHFMPDKQFIDGNCLDGVRVEVMLPSCWNGKDVTSSDHKSHMAYPDHVIDGTCPEGYQSRVPSLLYEIIYRTPAFKDERGRFVLANGDPTGYGMHADFLNGWNIDVLGKAVKTCTSESGNIEECSVFTLEMDDSKLSQCGIKLPKEAEEERCFEPRQGLCGNVVISGNAADYAEVVQEEAEDIGIEMAEPNEGEGPENKDFAQPPENDDVSHDVYAEPKVEPVAVPMVEPVAEPVVEDHGEGVDYDVPAPMITPHIEQQFAVDNEEAHDGEVYTITTTSDGVAYEVVVHKVVTTVTEDMDAAAAAPSPEGHHQAKRHLHHHQQRHLHKHL